MRKWDEGAWEDGRNVFQAGRPMSQLGDAEIIDALSKKLDAYRKLHRLVLESLATVEGW